MRQPDKHKKFNNPFSKEPENKVAAPEEEKVDLEQIPTGPEDGDFIDSPDGTFAESAGIYIGGEEKSAPASESEADVIEIEPLAVEDGNSFSDSPFVGDTAETEIPPVSDVPQKEEAVKEPQATQVETNAHKDESAPKRKKRKKNKYSTDSLPLWMRHPEKYMKRRPLWVRILARIFSFIFFWGVSLGVIGVLVLGVGITIIYAYTDPELDDKLANLELDYTSVIYANSLETGGYVEYEELYGDQNRFWVSAEEMPKALLDAVVAVEDKRFYDHNGVDVITTAKATINYALAKVMGRSTDGLAGGSTLTQQLVKNVSGDDKQDIARKIREMLRALYVERRYEKEQILEYYLNAVTFGNNQDGIYAAAKYYFDKEVKDLTPTECAAIVCITKSPYYIEPYRNPDRNKERRNHVLFEMWDQEKISRAEYEQYITEELVLRDRTAGGSSSRILSWFSDMVFNNVKADLMEKFGYSANEATSLLYTGGLRIYTTMVVEYQEICEEYFYNEDNYLPVPEGEEKPEIAFELFDPDTGNILAVIGGRGEKSSSRLLNRATDAIRQPGSSIKPLSVYGYAIENNIVTAGTAIDDSPLMIMNSAIKLLEGQSYLISPVTGLEIKYTYSPWPTNYDNTYNGYLDVKNALSNSYNTPAAKILEMIGVETSFNFVKTMLGLKNLVPQDMNLAPLSVGALTYGLTLQEVTSAYTVFANEGIYSSPRCVTRVETYDGKILYENEVDRQIVFTPQTAYVMTDILDALKGSAADAELDGIATAGKSGTTNSYKDRWFIGYTPNLLAGIWSGYDTPATNDNTHHINMWHDVMTLLEEASPGETGWTQPDGIVTAQYCTVSGKIPTKACQSDPRSSSRIKTGVYKAGTEPTEYCDMHHFLYVCNETGQIATEHCTDVSLAVFIDSDRSFPYMYIKTKDAEYVCPPLSPETILYNSQRLPVYSYMVPEGEYPCLPTTSKSKYVNCICSVHATTGINHYYTYNTLTAAEKIALAQRESLMTLPEDLIDPETLYTFYSDRSRYQPPTEEEVVEGAE